MSTNINICISCDDNYAKHAGVVIASVLLNAGEDDEFSFYILDGGISDKTKLRINRLKAIRNCDINFVAVDPEQFNIYNAVNSSKSSIVSYYRLKLTELLPKVDRVIYLDCDVIVRTSLESLFNTDLDDKYIAGVLDTRVKYKSQWKDTKYIDSGVLLIDLNRIRWDNAENIFLDYTQKHLNEIKTGIQDIINFALDGKIKIVDDKWNVQVLSFFKRSSFTNNPNIIHYSGEQKPWIFASYNHFKKDYFKILAKTPWKIPQEELYKWGKWNDFCAFIHFILGKSLFFFKLKFWDKILKSVPDEDTVK